ncbi:MAG TPA: DUF2127 domain-containing protein [Candidatus Saccharimonadales bacterium]
MEKMRHKAGAVFNVIYDTGVIIKGIDGAIELVAGLVLWLSPSFVHSLLTGAHNELAESQRHSLQYLAQYIGHLDLQLATAGTAFLVIFLISHGVIKLALVVALLKKIVRAYPVAMVVLGLFLIYQVYAFIRDPTISMALFCLLDIAIIGLVWREYRLLSSENMIQ